jgi:hypothetical protein
MTNETEVLRISGNVTVPKGEKTIFKNNFSAFLISRGLPWAGEITDQTDIHGMRLYRVEDVEAYQRLNHNYEEQIIKLNKTKCENDKLTLSLSEELAQERERIGNKDFYINHLEDVNTELMEENNDLKQLLVTKTIELRQRVKESRWRTFIKWWKGL